MFLRFAAIACASAMIAALAAPANAETGRCEATTFRIYFAHDASALSPEAMETISAAARNVAGCSYAELHVAVDAANPYAARRTEAIRAAAHSRGWDAVRIAPRLVNVATSGPDYAEVEMTPYAAPTLNTAVPADPDAGV